MRGGNAADINKPESVSATGEIEMYAKWIKILSDECPEWTNWGDREACYGKVLDKWFDALQKWTVDGWEYHIGTLHNLEGGGQLYRVSTRETLFFVVVSADAKPQVIDALRGAWPYQDSAFQVAELREFAPVVMEQTLQALKRRVAFGPEALGEPE